MSGIGHAGGVEQDAHLLDLDAADFLGRAAAEQVLEASLEGAAGHRHGLEDGAHVDAFVGVVADEAQGLTDRGVVAGHQVGRLAGGHPERRQVDLVGVERLAVQQSVQLRGGLVADALAPGCRRR